MTRNNPMLNRAPMRGRPLPVGKPESKPRKCKVCRARFVPTRPLQVCCGAACAAAIARAKREKAELEAAKRDRKETRAKLNAIKPRSKLIAEAQATLNRFARLRDAGKPCISCQRHHDGQWHAGHYRSTAAAPELRFDLDNIHAQCAPCNTHLSGNLLMYRKGLIDRIGLDRVEWLEGPHPPRKWSRDELIALRAEYLERAKAWRKCDDS